MSFNQVTLIGNLGKDPDIRAMNNGDQVCSFSIATSERWTDKATGQKKEATEWHNIVVFNQGLIKVIDQYCAKGKKIMVQGKMKTRNYEKDGVKHYVTEVVIGRFDGQVVLLGDSGGGGGTRDRDEHDYGTSRDRDVDSGRGFDAGGRGPASREEFSQDLDDEIPF